MVGNLQIKTDKELQTQLTEANAAVESFKAKLTEQKKLTFAIQNELNRRAINALWQEHPEWKLEPNDVLIVTDEFLRHEHALYRGNTSFDQLEYAYVHAVKMEGAEVVIDVGVEKGLSTAMGRPLAIIVRMRQAYLDATKQLKED